MSLALESLRSVVVGVLYVEDVRPQRFSYHHEDALAALVDVLGLAMRRLQEEGADACADLPAEAVPAPAPVGASGQVLQVRFYDRLSTVFVNGQYVIKGIAGAILWKMLREYQQSGRREFSSRELRADSSLNLPDITDNLATRLLLLQRRLDEMDIGIRLVKCGRGRVMLDVQHALSTHPA